MDHLLLIIITNIILLVSLACGSQSAENSTYIRQEAKSKFVSTDQTCAYSICQTNKKVCRIKFDFTYFKISDPVTGTVVTSASSGDSKGMYQCYFQFSYKNVVLFLWKVLLLETVLATLSALQARDWVEVQSFVVSTLGSIVSNIN